MKQQTTTTEQKLLTINVQAISVICPCGEYCENETGSTMIEVDEKVQCLNCGTYYEIDPRAFTTFHQTLEETTPRSLDEVYAALQRTFELVRKPGKNALVVQIEGYAHKLSCDPDAFRQALLALIAQKRITARKMAYPESVPESWEIELVQTEGVEV